MPFEDLAGWGENNSSETEFGWIKQIQRGFDSWSSKNTGRSLVGL